MNFATRRGIAPVTALATAALAAAALAAPAHAAVGVAQVRQGDTGFAVYCVQDAIDWSIPEHLALDGSFGPLTFQGVEDFQRVAYLHVDGEVGPQTGTDVWAAIQDQISTVGNLATPYGIPLSHCYQVIPTYH